MKKMLVAVMATILSLNAMLTSGCSFLKAKGESKTENEKISEAKSKQECAERKPNLAKPKSGAINVSAADLVKDYQRNETAADEKYKGNDIAVTGKVDSYSFYSVDDDINIYLDAGGTDAVSCYLDLDEKENVFFLKKGQKVTLQCEGDGKLSVYPHLKNCKVQNIGE